MIPATELADYMAAIESIVTSIGILAAGLWTYQLFVRNRQKLPKASLVHDIILAPLASGDSLLHVGVTVKNEGSVLISIESGSVRVSPMVDVEGNPLAPVDEPCPPGERQEFQWTHLAKKPLCQKHEIEPGESDCMHFQFRLPRGTDVFQVYSHFSNISKPNRKVGWNCTTIHSTTNKDSLHATRSTARDGFALQTAGPKALPATNPGFNTTQSGLSATAADASRSD